MAEEETTNTINTETPQNNEAPQQQQEQPLQLENFTLPRELFTDSGRNTKNVHCKFCNSLILEPDTASLISTRISLHTNKANQEIEDLEEFWKVIDIFHFANVAFSKQVQAERSYKYLTCADCEYPILGIQYLDDPACYVSVSHGRVNYA